MDNNLQQAIVLIKAGNKKQGGQILAEIVKNEPRNVNAWLWLSSCVNNDEQRIYCLKKVVEINPEHQTAIAALSKLQHPEQPSEKEILGNGERTPPTVSISQTRQASSPIQNTGVKTTAFQPKYLTAIAGMSAMIGTGFTWAIQGSQKNIIEEYSGLTQAPGVITAIIGLAIVFIALFQQTKPRNANSPISSIFALVTLLLLFNWAFIAADVCLEEFLAEVAGGSGADANCYRIGTGFGFGLSMWSLVFVFIFGLIPNPKKQ